MLTIDVDPDDEAITRLRQGHTLQPGQSAVDLVPLGDGSQYWLPKRFDLIESGADGRAGWRIKLDVHQGVPYCREITFTAVEGDVKAADLRAIRIEDMIELATRYLARPVHTDAQGRTFPQPISLAEIRKGLTLPAVRQARRPARRKTSPQQLTDIADIYRQHPGRNPTQAIAQHLGCAPRTARWWVQQARHAGLLGPATPGKAGEHPPAEPELGNQTQKPVLPSQ